MKPKSRTWWELCEGISPFPPGGLGHPLVGTPQMCGRGRDLWGLERPRCSCPAVPPGHRGLGGQWEAIRIRAWKCLGSAPGFLPPLGP